MRTHLVPFPLGLKGCRAEICGRLDGRRVTACLACRSHTHSFLLARAPVSVSLSWPRPVFPFFERVASCPLERLRVCCRICCAFVCACVCVRAPTCAVKKEREREGELLTSRSAHCPPPPRMRTCVYISAYLRACLPAFLIILCVSVCVCVCVCVCVRRVCPCFCTCAAARPSDHRLTAGPGHPQETEERLSCQPPGPTHAHTHTHAHTCTYTVTGPGRAATRRNFDGSDRFSPPPRTSQCLVRGANFANSKADNFSLIFKTSLKIIGFFYVNAKQS